MIRKAARLLGGDPMAAGRIPRTIRSLTISAFVFDAVAAGGFIVVMASGDGHMRPLDGFFLTALVLGFLSALGAILIATPQARTAEQAPLEHVDRGGLPAFERRSGVDRRSSGGRRVSDLSLDTVLSPLPERTGQPRTH